MGYIKVPEPADDEVLFVDADGREFTWGEHRAMERELKLLEATNVDVKAARIRLDETLEANGINPNPPEKPLICEHCGREEFLRHIPECPDYLKDLPITREAGGYKYLDENFVECHVTSVHATDEEALDYFRIVQLMFPRSPDFKVKYIMRREMHSFEYKMLPWYYDAETKEVRPIERGK